MQHCGGWGRRGGALKWMQKSAEYDNNINSGRNKCEAIKVSCFFFLFRSFPSFFLFLFINYRLINKMLNAVLTAWGTRACGRGRPAAVSQLKSPELISKAKAAHAKCILNGFWKLSSFSLLLLLLLPIVVGFFMYICVSNAQQKFIIMRWLWSQSGKTKQDSMMKKLCWILWFVLTKNVLIIFGNFKVNSVKLNSYPIIFTAL